MNEYMCVYLCKYVCVCVCVCINACIYVCMHICVYVCMHFFMYVCLQNYVWINVYVHLFLKRLFRLVSKPGIFLTFLIYFISLYRSAAAAPSCVHVCYFVMQFIHN
jgi:hypothetical protein